MSKAASHHARNLVIMVNAGGVMEDVLEMARSFKVRAVHVQQLAVADEERAAQHMLTQALRPTKVAG